MVENEAVDCTFDTIEDEGGREQDADVTISREVIADTIIGLTVSHKLADARLRSGQRNLPSGIKLAILWQRPAGVVHVTAITINNVAYISVGVSTCSIR